MLGIVPAGLCTRLDSAVRPTALAFVGGSENAETRDSSAHLVPCSDLRYGFGLHTYTETFFSCECRERDC